MFVLAALLGFWLIGMAQPVTVEWDQRYGGTASDQAFALAQTPDGGFVIGGYTNSFGNGSGDIFVVKTDADGDSLWSVSMGSPFFDQCNVLYAAPDGSIYVGASMLNAAFTEQLAIIKLSASGDSLWAIMYGDSADDACEAITATADGNLIAAGYSGDPVTETTDGLLIKFTPAGAILWERSFGGDDYDAFYDIQLTDDDGFIMVGIERSFGGGFSDGWLMRVNSNGDSLWSKSYGGLNLDRANAVRQLPDGGFALGLTEGSFSGSANVWLVVTDENGDSLWTHSYGGSDLEFCEGLALLPDGGFALSGETRSFGNGDRDYFLIRVSATGDSMWSAAFGGEQSDQSYALLFLEDFSFALAGRRYYPEGGVDDMWLVKTTAENFPPSEFVRVMPEDDVTYGIDSITAVFNWTSSTDLNGNDVSYLFELSSDPPMWLEETVLSDTFTIVHFEIPVSSLDEIFEINWSVRAISGGDTVAAANGDGTFYMELDLAADEQRPELPRVASLRGFPNPFNASASLSVEIATPGNYDVTLFDITGRHVATLFSGQLNHSHVLHVNGTNLATGVYIAELQQAGNSIAQTKLLLLK